MADSEEVNVAVEYLTVEMIFCKRTMFLKSDSTLLSVPKKRCEHNI